MPGSLTFKWKVLTSVGVLLDKPIERVGPEVARVSMRASSRGLPMILGTPEPMAEVIDETIANVRVRRYRPIQAEPGLVVYFHGGGWVIGDVDTHDIPCRAIASRSRRTVVSVDYRLAPEHRFPAAIDDCLAVTAALCGPEPIVVAGDSAGGHLAAVVTRHLHDVHRPIAGQLLIYPVTDCSKESDSYRRYGTGYFLTASTMRYFVNAFLPEASTRSHPDASPLLADLRALPPTYVLLAECDVLRDEGLAYARRLTAAGTKVTVDEVPGVIHGFFSMQGMREGREAAGRVARFLDDVFRSP